MLRRLRKQMVLLNAFISGAILLTMALVALNVSENLVARQYIRDLESNAQALLSTMQQDAGSTVRVQFATNYSVYYRIGNQQRLITSVGGDGDAVARIASEAQTVLAEKISRTESLPHLEDEVKVDRYFWINSGAADDGSTSSSLLLRGRVQLTLSDIQLSDGNKSYRAAAIRIMGTPEQELTVLQDRTDELATVAQLRWMFFGCVLGGLLLTGCASLYLSTRSIRPVERSIRQQRDFVAAASHELRTPVAAVRANAEVLADAPLGEFMPYRDAIEQESHRMSRLVNDLIDLARADAGELQVCEEPIDCAEIARRTITLLSPLAAEKNIALASALEPAVCKADPDRLCQIVVVLLDNAIRYTQPGGHVRIATEKSGAHALICVSDDGPGIPDAQKAQVFERFFRVDAARSDGGCGLGLSVARQFAERMNGTLTLADHPGGGCVFTVKLKA